MDRDKSDYEIKQSLKENKKKNKTDDCQKATDQSTLDSEISTFAEKVESSINMDYILKKIIG